MNSEQLQEGNRRPDADAGEKTQSDGGEKKNPHQLHQADDPFRLHFFSSDHFLSPFKVIAV
jgi:hypothetical protein